MQLKRRKPLLDRYTDRFALYTENKEDGSIDPYASYQQLFLTGWNNEIIWARNNCSFWSLRQMLPGSVTDGLAGILPRIL